MSYLDNNARELAESYILYPMARGVLEKDKLIIENSSMKIKSPYLTKIDNALKAIHLKLRETKAKMRKENLKIVEVERGNSYVMYRYYWKGYSGDMQYLNANLKNRVTGIILELFNL